MKKSNPAPSGVKNIVLTAAATFVGTLLLILLAAWLIIGPEGLTLLEGLALIHTRFVGEYETEEVLDSAMNGMIAGLGDRWSYYLNPQSYQAQKEIRSNEYVGIGVTVSYEREEGLLILAVQSGGPAEKAGLCPGELITEVDGEPLHGDARYQGAGRIQGERGTQAVLTLLSEDGQTRSVTVTRDTVEEDPVSYELLPSGTGYIRVKNFYLRSSDRVKAAVEALKTQGASALIFDMRNNGGGYLDELLPMLDFLLPEGPIFRFQNRAGEETVRESDASCVELPMLTLVNGDTYSAAEIFAAELQEMVGAKIVGTATSGKGYSQQTYPLFGGGAVGLSTNRYFTGKGVSLVGTGVTLDVEAGLSEEDSARLRAGNLPHDQDAQLQAALELLQHSGAAG